MALNNDIIKSVGLEKLKSLKTPFLIYDLDIAEKQFHIIKKIITRVVPEAIVAYSYKTNTHIAEKLLNLGASTFVTSIQHFKEIEKHLNKNAFVVFNHPAYTGEELKLLLPNRQVILVLESWTQIQLADEVCRELNINSQILLRVDTGIRSGSTPFKMSENLGAPITEVDSILQKAQGLKALSVAGIHNHFASENIDLNSWQKNIEILEEIINRFPEIRILNLGGGWPIEYTEPVPSLEEIIGRIGPIIDRLRKNKFFKLIVEPGRFIAGPCGKLFTKVLDVRERKISEVIVDASILRCFGDRLFWGLSLKTTATNLTSNDEQLQYFIRGNSSVSIDDFGQLKLSRVSTGDLLVFHQAGGYFTAIETSFTGAPKPDEYLFDNGNLILIKKTA